MHRVISDNTVAQGDQRQQSPPRPRRNRYNSVSTDDRVLAAIQVETEKRRPRSLSFPSKCPENYGKKASPASDKGRNANGILQYDQHSLLHRMLTPFFNANGVQDMGGGDKSESQDFQHDRPNRDRRDSKVLSDDGKSRRPSVVLRDLDDFEFVSPEPTGPTVGPARLSQAVTSVLLEHRMADYVNHEELLPLYMRAGQKFGCDNQVLTDYEFQRWRKRCSSWAERAAALREAGGNAKTTCLKLERASITRSPLLVTAVQTCPHLSHVSLRSCWLSDSALSALAISIRGHLRTLDLTYSRGFGDVGVKSLAAFAPGLEDLKLFGCEVSDEGLEKVALFCTQLRHVEVTDSPAVSHVSLSLLSKDCTVKRSKIASLELLGRRPFEETMRSPRTQGHAQDLTSADQRQSIEGARPSAAPRGPRGTTQRRVSVMSRMSGISLPFRSTRNSIMGSKQTAVL